MIFIRIASKSKTIHLNFKNHNHLKIVYVIALILIDLSEKRIFAWGVM